MALTGALMLHIAGQHEVGGVRPRHLVLLPEDVDVLEMTFTSPTEYLKAIVYANPFPLVREVVIPEEGA